MKLLIDTPESLGDAGLRGLSLGGGYAWAGGTGGTVASTADGGASWFRVPVPGYEGLDFRSVAVLGPLEAVIASAGQPSLLLRTEDGGASWSIAWEDASGEAFIDAIALAPDGTGLALGDPLGGCFILRTRDSGRSWERLPGSALPAVDAGESSFAASGTCLARLGDAGFCFVTGGSRARFHSTIDVRSWRSVDLPLAAGVPSRGAFSVAALGRRLCVVGGDYAEPTRGEATAAYSEDGGASWRLAERGPGAYCSCVAWAQPSPGSPGGMPALVAVGTEGCFLSADGGSSWERASREPFHAVAFFPEDRGAASGRGLAVGAGGRIAVISVAP